MSHDTFNIHLRNLHGNGLLGKTTKGHYFLTDKAYFLHRLKILEFKRLAFLDGLESEEVERRLKMHLILSFYGRSKCVYHLQSKEQFEDLLSRHKLCENDLRLFREYDIEYKGQFKHIKEFFSNRGIEIRIVDEKLNETISEISYDYFLPGFGITDISKAMAKNPQQFYYLDFTRSDLQEKIDMLVTEDLMERIGEFDNQTRYRFSDQYALGRFTDLYDDLFKVMGDIWEYLRSPKEEEKKWLEFFYGNVEGWLQDLRHNRSSRKRKNRNAIDHITDSMPEIHKDFKNLIDGHKNQKYTFFIDKLLEYVYPVFMRNPFSSAFEERRSYATSK